MANALFFNAVQNFEKSIILNHEKNANEETYISGLQGQLRFNNSSLKFEGYHGSLGADIFGNSWRSLTQDVASASNLGIIKVGNNLLIQPSTGILSSVATGVSRIYQLVITVSPIVGAADYQTINTAITNAIGTSVNNYTDGSITSIIGSAPSTTYPFIIQLSPGLYSEALNQIVLPDYVSIRGEDNYNSIIIQNAGNTVNLDVETGSMIIAGQNCEIRNLVVRLSDTSNSLVSNAIYSSNKSNIVIDSCILTCNTAITTTSNTYSIYMNGGQLNSITNCQFLINSPSLTGAYTGINIINSTPRIINNNIDILTSNTNVSVGISLSTWDETESIMDKTYIENLTLSNNYKNTTEASAVNIGILLNNSPVLLKNSDIEVTNIPTLLKNNYAIQFDSDTPLLVTTSSNIVSFVNTPPISNLANVSNIIYSSNISVVNFINISNQIGFQQGQYISVVGSSYNDGIFKVKSVISSSEILLEDEFQVITEPVNISNTIVIKALYSVDICNSKLNSSLAALENNDNNSNYLFNLNNAITVGIKNITPSYTFYTTYKTLKVGKVNCNYNSLSSALDSITDNSSNTRYLIKIESGIYQESTSVICKEYVNIEGNGENNTSLLFYQSSNVSTTDSSCILLSSNMKMYGLTIKNSSNNYLILNDLASIVLYNPSPITNVILENINIESICSSYYNTGIHLLSAITNIVLRNVNITVNSNMDVNINIGIFNNLCIDVSYYNVSIVVAVIGSLPKPSYSYALSLEDSECNIYNSSLLCNSGIIENYCIKTSSTNTQQNLVKIFNSQIKITDSIDYSIDYSIYAAYYYTIICNNVQLLGDTYTSSVSSRIFCNGCYTFNSLGDKLDIQSINSRGQNEQTAYNTITIGDYAGKLNSNGLNNVIIGVQAGSNLTTGESSTIIGSHSGHSITTAINNTLLGSYTGQAITSGNYNTVSGSYAGYSLTTANNNLISGETAGYSLTTGGTNTIVGARSAYNLQTGINNTFVGYGSAYSSNTASRNTFVGYATGDNNETGDDNIYIGYQTGHANIIGNNNLLIGKQSGYTNTSNDIVSIGNSSGYNNTNSLKTTYLGTNSGYNNTTGNCNTYLGSNAGFSSISASGGFNTAIGNEAGFSITSGSRNVLIGGTTNENGLSNDSAGWSLENGTDNIHIGVAAGSNAISSINNILIGSGVGSAITTAGNNVLIGKNAGTSLDVIGQSVIIGAGTGDLCTSGNALLIGYNAGALHTGNEAFAIGYNAGSNISGNFNMFIGYNSGGLPKVNTTGSNNLAIGPYTGFNLSSGARNILIGSGDSTESVGRQLSTGSDNTLIGYKSGKAIQTGIGNTLIGSNAGANLTNGQDNLVLGYNSAFNLNTGGDNVSLGPYAGYNLTSGSGNIYSGYQSGYNNSIGNYNINMGYQAGYASSSNDKNIHIGFNAGYSSLADNNLFIGYQSGLKNTLGTNNIFIGAESGAGNNTNNEQIGANNIFVGTKAGTSNDNGYSNIFMGSNTGASSISGSKNIFIGENAGSLSTTSHNIFIGTASTQNDGIGRIANTTGQYNVFIGTDVGIANTTGADNIFLGGQAGRNNTTGIQNIYLGVNAGRDADAGTADNNIAIGTDAGIHNRSGQDNILIGKSVAGLSTSTDYTKNIIIGSSAGQYIQQDNQIFIGTNAGKLNTTGDRNIFIGLNTGYANIVSDNNVVIGSDAGVSLIGNGLIGDNVIIGSEAGHDLTTGTNNIYIGSGAGINATTSVNNVVIGANAMSNGNSSNVIIIGRNAGQNNTGDANIFIGSNAGVHTSSGLGNIYIGHESGYAITTSNGNIIFGNETSSTGRIADNNIILGNQTAKGVSNKAYFANNIVMGADAGKTSNLAINSIMIGTNAVGAGTGGDVNIIMGNNTAIHLGDQHNFYATTLTPMTYNITHNVNNDSNYVTIDIAFGTGAYYFNYGDTIAIESLTNDYVFQSQISAIIIDNDNIGNNGKTKLILNEAPLETIPIGSIVYVKNVKQNEIGPEDYSKSSSNMCIGDHNGFELTTGSKNASIGDNAMYSNKVGRYNIAFGTEAGYSLNTDNNLCLGIKAGYSIDSYKDTSVVDDFIFYQSNNTITSVSSNFTNLPYGTVFEIAGSSSNDSRYNINNSTQNSIIVQGYPRIVENGLVSNPSQTDFILGGSELFYINYSITSNIQFYAGKIVINYINTTIASADYIIIQNATHFTISGSQYNNGIKVINYYLINGFTSAITLNNIQITILTIQNNYTELDNNSVTLTINNIATNNLLNSLNNNSFNNNIFSSDIIYIQYGNKSSQYKTTISQPYYFYNIYDYNGVTSDVSLLINGIVLDKQLTNNTNSTDNLNKLYIQGYNTSITIKNVILSLDSVPHAGTHFTYFNITDNTIEISAYGTPAYFVLPPTGVYDSSPYITNSLIEIIGSQYNDGYYFVTSSSDYKAINSYTQGLILFIDQNYLIKQNEINTGIVIMKQVAIKNSIFDSIYNSSSDFKGNILKIKYRNSTYQNYAFGTYVLENYYSGWFGLNDNLLKFYGYPDTFTGTSASITTVDSIKLDMKFCDTGLKTITNNYISSNDLIFQTSNISFSNVSSYFSINSNNTITTNIDYEFVHIIAPVIIKIEGSTNGNNGFFLVNTNPHPFTILYLNAACVVNDELNTTAITLKTNNISSYLGNVNLSNMIIGTNYLIQGSKYNDDNIVSIYNGVNTISTQSLYLSDASIIVNDTYNDFGYSLTKNLSVNNNIGTTTNIGYFQNFTLNNVVSTVNSDTQISFTYIDQFTIGSLISNQYLKLTGTTPTNNYDGLYCINTISVILGGYQISFLPKYQDKNGNIQIGNPFIGATFSSCNIISNQFIFNGLFYINNGGIQYPAKNIDWYTIISGFGENAKFIKFTCRDGTISNFNTKVVSPITGTVSNNSLTFQIESYNLNLSNIAVSIVETCPQQGFYYDTGTNDSPTTIYCHFASYIIDFGSPNPSTRVSDIYRNRMRPIIYSGSDISYNNFNAFGHSGATYTFSASGNTITASNFSSVSYSNNIIYGKLFSKDNFAMFYAGQVIYSIEQSQYLLISSISSDFNTLYLDATFSTVSNSVLIGANFTTQYSIYDATLNCKDINTSYFGDNYSLLTFKNTMSTGVFTNSDTLLSELYFPINTISTSNSSVSNMTIPYIINSPSRTINPITFHYNTVTGSADISFNSISNQITSITTNLSSFNPNEFILISGTLYNNGLYLIDPNGASSNTIKISSSYALVNEVNKNATLLTNSISSSIINDLLVYNNSLSLVITTTVFNNTTFLVNTAINNGYANTIFVNSPNVTNETVSANIIGYSNFIKTFQNLQELCMNHTMLIPTDNIIDNYTNLSFHNLTVNGSSDISFYSSNNTITSITTDLSSFLQSEYILVSGTSNNNFLYRINDTTSPISNKIIISIENLLTDETNSSATILANNINTSNIYLTDLSVFAGNQYLLASLTVLNNNTYLSNIETNSSYSIFIDSPLVITELPKYCTIEKSIIIDEISSIIGKKQYTSIDYTDLSFHNTNIFVSPSDLSYYSSNNTITSVTSNLAVFLTSEYIQIYTSNNSGLYRINDSISPTSSSIIIAPEYILFDELPSAGYSHITANNINSSNILTSNLAIYSFSNEPLTISNTLLNNNTLTTHSQYVTSQSPYSLLMSSSVTNETPVNCTISRIFIGNQTIYSNLSFHNASLNVPSPLCDIIYYASNNTITSVTSNLAVFQISEFIQLISDLNTGVYRINDSISPTNTSIIIAPEYTLISNIATSTFISARTINSSNIITSNLAIYNGVPQIVVYDTLYNNNILNINPITNAHSIYVNSSITNEIPISCTIGIREDGDISFNNNQISLTDNLIDLSTFRTGQQLAITGTSYNNTNITISESVIPSNISITINQALVNETNTSAVLTKQIDFSIIGEPVQIQITNTYTELYHYEDAEGNNTMIGSFAGQFVGSLNNAIYNVAIGSRCGQVNHGSGNIFIGNDSKLAFSATEGSTTYTNKFAVYKNNSLGIPSNPLIGGDFGTGRVGINTINPESFSTYTDVTLTDTKLVVNGGAIANAFSPFTGCHIVNFISSNVSISTTNNSTTNNSISNAINDLSNTIKVGMIVSSIGIIKKSSIINTYCSVKLSSVSNDKTVFGVYAFKEQSRETADNEYIIDSNGKYVKNLSYNNTMVNLYYVAALGEGCILITNINGEIQNGDYITTCPIAGYGALQSDDILHSYTVAKCTETIDWAAISNSSNIIYNDISYKTYLTGCTYHCG